jgi:hypothetical protein
MIGRSRNVAILEWESLWLHYTMQLISGLPRLGALPGGRLGETQDAQATPLACQSLLERDSGRSRITGGPASGTSIETVFYVTLSRLKVTSVKR